MRILNVAYPLAAVGPDAVGGAEKILWQVDAALSAAGHRSVVVAATGSRTAGELAATPLPSGPLTEAVRQEAHAAHRRAIADVVRREPIDLIHLHGIDFHHYRPEFSTPVLVTLHLPLDWYPPASLAPGRPGLHFQGVSSSQYRAFPPSAAFWPPIENGVELPRLPRGGPRKQGYVLALGRICPEKGFHLALDAARRADVDCLLAGQVFRYEAHERYFAAEIRPRLDARRRFLGPVGGARKRRLLAGARCLLVSSSAPETSCLVALEALAHGTPVVALANGALPDIIEEGRTGFLVRDEAEMALAIAATEGIDPQTCREAAATRFSARRMTGRYLELYDQILTGSGREVNGHAP